MLGVWHINERADWQDNPYCGHEEDNFKVLFIKWVFIPFGNQDGRFTL
jgi:hypothetical protein